MQNVHVMRPEVRARHARAVARIGNADDAFLTRLERFFTELHDPLHALYGEDDRFPAAWDALLDLIAATAAERDPALRRLDHERGITPDWLPREQAVGYVAYGARFAGTLRGVRERLPYLRELGVSYLHLMPLLRMRREPNDGGYAVADYAEVEPALGTMEDLRELAAQLRAAGIALCVDVVLNHTAREHPWAVAARAGDARRLAFYRTFPDRSEPDAYERTIPDVFPDTAPGSFTFDEELGRWVWTTFNPYQWDLDHSNPEVFLAMAQAMLGLTAAGVDVLRLGVLPTPGVARLTGALRADLGVMISASHNPMPDNGIKFLARGGVKLDDDLERVIERRLREPWDRPTGAAVGRISDYEAAVVEYAAHLTATTATSLEGLRVVLDCAHGAAYVAGPLALQQAGAQVVAISAEPDGRNINDGCGSTHLEPLRAAVVAHGADVGFALDGDADRCLAVDASGEVVDGDQLLALLALALREDAALTDDTVVATVMSNLGFLQAMEREGVKVEQTKVGDRYVLEAMGARGYSLGGEQSGHVILSRYATTGDGILTALQVLARMAATGRPLAELAGVMTRLPQVLVNVDGVDKARADSDEVLAAAVVAEEAELAGTGRVLLRSSGTEPLVRVMVEAATAERARDVADRLAAVVRERLAL